MSDRDLAIPERLGRYEIVERLSAGGMGEVFVARYAGPGGFMKPVALKRIHPHLAEDPQFIHMLHDEANVAAAVKHPNIVSTIDVGFEDGNHFVVLDFVSGDPLSRLVRDMKRRSLVMPPWVAAWVGAETAAALHAAHEAKNLAGERLDIVHRDVSLQNVMLSDAGHPLLFDFGVAKAKQRIVQTSHGELKGKLAYMAPETFRGAPVDRTVDVFSLGVVIYELLTNVSPFQRQSDLDTITALTSAPVLPPSQLQRVDARLDAIVLAAMARERSQRYQTAAQVEHALRDWARATGAPHEAGPVGNWLAATFPERLAARRALLARIADPQRKYRPPHAAAAGPQPHAPAAPAGTPPPGMGWGLTPGGGFAPHGGPGVHPGTDPRAVITGPGGYPHPGTDPRAAVTAAPHPGTDPRAAVAAPVSSPGTDPRSVVSGTFPTSPGSQVTELGLTRMATGAPPSKGRAAIAGFAAAGVLVGGLVVYFVAGRATVSGAPAEAPASASSNAGASTAAPAPAAPPVTAATASTAASASPTASAAPSSTAAPQQRHVHTTRPVAPTAPAEGSKARGPIKRDYE